MACAAFRQTASGLKGESKRKFCGLSRPSQPEKGPRRAWRDGRGVAGRGCAIRHCGQANGGEAAGLRFKNPTEMRCGPGDGESGGRGRRGGDGVVAVSFTHLTLPTNREGDHLGGRCSITKKKE